jgi:hypothetical protein
MSSSEKTQAAQDHHDGHLLQSRQNHLVSSSYIKIKHPEMLVLLWGEKTRLTARGQWHPASLQHLNHKPPCSHLWHILNRMSRLGQLVHRVHRCHGQPQLDYIRLETPCRTPYVVVSLGPYITRHGIMMPLATGCNVADLTFLESSWLMTDSSPRHLGRRTGCQIGPFRRNNCIHTVANSITRPARCHNLL